MPKATDLADELLLRAIIQDNSTAAFNELHRRYSRDIGDIVQRQLQISRTEADQATRNAFGEWLSQEKAAQLLNVSDLPNYLLRHTLLAAEKYIKPWNLNAYRKGTLVTGNGTKADARTVCRRRGPPPPAVIPNTIDSLQERVAKEKKNLFAGLKAQHKRRKKGYGDGHTAGDNGGSDGADGSLKNWGRISGFRHLA